VAFDARLPGHISKGSIAVVPEKVIVGRIFDGRRIAEILDRRSVDDVEVHIPIIVVVEPDTTAAVDLENPILLGAATSRQDVDPRLQCDIPKSAA
jgi:hypothetical protein